MNLANGINIGIFGDGFLFWVGTLYSVDMILDENMHPDSSTEFDSSSSCSTASPGGDTPGCSQRPPDSPSSSVDSAKVEADLIFQKGKENQRKAIFKG